MWANPFTDRSLTCSEASWAAAFPAITVSISFCWFCVFYAAREASVPLAMACSCLILAALFFGSVSLLFLSANCDDVDHEFVLSMALMVVVPLALPICVACLSLFMNCLDSCARAVEGPTGSTERQRPKRNTPRVRRAQRMLREALILGDSNVADLLLDFKERRCHGLWRMYRCVFMTFMHCQLRCSCCAGVPEDDAHSPISPASATGHGGHTTPTSRASVSRASLFFSYDDEDAGEMCIHYLSRGEHFAREGASGGPSAAAQRCLLWGGQRRTLPELTDERRARLLRDLVSSGRLPFGQLYVVNAHAQTPLHCAASSGSCAVIQELWTLGTHTTGLGAAEEVEEAGGEMLWAEDINGDSPCEAALKKGHVSAARLLAGDHGQWQGLLKLSQQRHALRECLAGALGQMSPDPPETASHQKSKMMIHEDAEQLLVHLNNQIHELQQTCGLVLAGTTAQLLPRNAAEALLRSNEFDVQAAATAFRASPREALDLAGLRGLNLRLASDVDTVGITLIDASGKASGTATSSLCIVCFDEVNLESSACKISLCQHTVCDNCMAMHIKVRLDEGDVSGVACPEPNCRLPITEDILKRIFGSDSPEQARLEQLKTLKFVDMSKNMAWCPSPGCGRVVSYPSQGEKVKAMTVVCSCGVSFCFTCKQIGGHEPAPCQSFADFLKDLALVRRQMQDETNKWLSKNSKTCSCGAIIQRSGGCNHMICSVCGRHFCYMCGQDWAPHRGQPGGFDYYQCRLPTSAGNTSDSSPTAKPVRTRDGQLWKLQRECLPGWTASERQPERLKLLFRALLCLAEEFNLGIGLEEPRGEGDSSFISAVSRESQGGRQSAWEALLACIKARRCLQNCYVLKYHWEAEQWRRSRLRNWVPELEGIVGALESAIGVTLLESQAVNAGFPTSAEVVATGAAPKQLPKNPKDVLRLFDLRQLLPQVIAISETLSTLRQLSRAVALQTARILDAGKSGFPEVGLAEEAWTRAFGDMPRRTRSERCTVM